jgi:hypothetical protein
MPPDGGELEIDVDGTSIVVTDPKTDFTVIYQKQFGNPQLVLTYSWMSENETSPTIAAFRRRAFAAAIAKARELGWIS